jgi:nitrate reductase cytochrome c-type subunit
MRTALIAASFLLAAGLHAQGGKPAAKPVADTALGLSKTSVFEIPAPPRYKDEASSPGDKPALPRANRETPPRIPHGIAEFLPITRTANQCADCHDTGAAKKKGEATPIPASHYVDLRHAPEKKGAKLVGARYVCTACHVALTDARPLVGNTYRK